MQGPGYDASTKKTEDKSSYLLFSRGQDQELCAQVTEASSAQVFVEQRTVGIPWQSAEGQVSGKPL